MVLMELPLFTTPTNTLLTLNHNYPHFSTALPIQIQRIFSGDLNTIRNFTSIASTSVKSLSAVVVRPHRSRLQCVSSSAASGGGGGGGIGGGGDGGGGDGALNGGDEKVKSVVDVSESSTDVIILDVGGMSCGGCVASVKRILESQPQVSSASVDLTTETAVVWPVSEAKSLPDWQKTIGTELAKHLTSCGFQSNLRGESATAGDIPS